jgi:hypothetical protein
MLASTAKASPPTSSLEQVTKKIAIAEAAVSVFGEGRVVGHVAIEPQPAKPAIAQIEMNLVAQPPLGPDAIAVADQQHPDHQFWVDRGATYLAIVRLNVNPNARQIDEPIDFAKHVVARDMPF